VIRAAVQASAQPPAEGAAEAPPLPRWTLKRLVAWVEERFAHACGRETLRRALHRLGLSWKKAKKLLGRADPGQRAAFVERIQGLLSEASRDARVLVYIDEAHIHQDVDPGYGWSVRGERHGVCSTSPGLSAKVSFYGVYLYNEGQVELWPYPRANGAHTQDVLARLKARLPGRKLTLLWDGAPYHRARAVQQRAGELGIEVIPLPAYSPDFMPVEALWRALREDVTYHHCHASPTELTDRVDAFRQRVNANPCALADRLWVKDHLDPDEEKLRIPK
jgi:transposase